ncbi:MAG: hypothetical protein A3I26_00105 [Candidatus Yanofskybacteria bacterium RIFCSPLOWO2_02_FULL_43_10]|uniref:Uncharacterized protein n=1 Tax=Candidatus Yanofskybacteria bacterium RIFCSPLOWO2_12_FULL_43_11b TaxID=1802710 RepID=A0A1F8H6S3_9BACT|nr:MAG: hypothetical protein A2742_03390 [Candidatus Yanofskybacteria bacterium RIFCSPHIGHO2_01_FULL_43_32]OGN12143.1 MAG: hypothetical protein A3C69_02245 [Candidatus Yanofskybacteria bacterium RIFCSPHIGHO2_02_FULL_43_12]OGN18248.1 MAG: hypothetical protein A3E34_02450 [Candidatus Yanofskybacteria bacterium RIFCSPHIGHO2_12_FULL_43_11]OGN25209.1 MAG: hypothetical protein A2923_00515 [Candidatus Yanofskybacteria bacterium RIFCSPLOWO2_01_FULL_43_46]OGN29274.1 MAG: hypothetical protein A3I26_00105
MVSRLLAVLAWVAGILFFWSSWGVRTFWGFDALYWGWSVVVLVLLAKASMFCGCCKWGKGMGGEKECPACMGKGGEHMHPGHPKEM